MEKLIELLNKYDKIKWDKEEPIYNWKIAIKTKIYQTYLVSARYWFIKWLVENDKIDIEKLQDKDAEYSFHYSFEDYEVLLMLLSISNSPIEDLISYLK